MKVLERKGWVYPIKKASIYLFFIGLGLVSCKRKKIPVAKPGALAVRVRQVQTRDMYKTLPYIGTVRSTEEIKILARAAGKLVELPVAEGQTASKGTVLARISIPEINARLAALKAKLAKLELESRFACDQAVTDRKLLKNKAISKIKADLSEQKCRAGKQGVKALIANLNEVRLIKAHSREQAPFDGMVLKWIAKPGENIMPGRPIMIFGGKDKEIRVWVQERDLLSGAVRQGQTVLVMPGTKQEFRSKVTGISPLSVGPARLVEVRIALHKKTPVAHGMSIKLAFVTAQSMHAMVVPAGAVGPGNEVFKLVNGRIHRVKVARGITRAGWTEVKSRGLKPGDWVVNGDLDVLQDDMKVYPVRPQSNSTGERL